MSFAKFMELALYHPQVGYYRRTRRRVGYGAGTDFYTSSTSGAVFGELVAAACARRLQAAGRDPSRHVFIEIGAEPESGGILANVSHEFREAKSARLGDALTVTGDCIVFSNELLDAQPFVRSQCRNGQWIELGVELRGDTLVEVALDNRPPCVPVSCMDGYNFDQPHAAATLVETIAAQDWHGLFVAIDYGKTYRELIEDTPAGTARAYHRHKQSNDLLARPGGQDLTCHVCWDWISDALTRHGFTEPGLDFQESFFIRHAGERIAAWSAADAATFSPRKLSLLQLLHPSHLGQKFQVLHALR